MQGQIDSPPMIPTSNEAERIFQSSTGARGRLSGIFAPERVLVTMEGEAEPTSIPLDEFDADWTIVEE